MLFTSEFRRPSPSTPLLLLATLASLSLQGTLGFVMHPKTGRSVCRRWNVKPSSWEEVPSDSPYRGQGDDELEALEKARASFEQLVSVPLTHEEMTGHSSPASSRPPELFLLTETGRRRRQVELELLQSLRDSDDAANELMTLWMSEHSAQAAQQLQAMEESCSDGLVEEERALQRLVWEHADWAEPAIRLASLYYYKGRTRDAWNMCQHGLSLKPWHFEGRHLLTLLALREQDAQQAVCCARDELPRLLRIDGVTPSQRRLEWIARAVQQAREQWEYAEEVTRAYYQQQKDIMMDDTAINNNEQQQVWQ